MRYQRYIMIYFCFLELEFSRFFGRIHHYHFLLRIIYIMELFFTLLGIGCCRINRFARQFFLYDSVVG